jgi:hypothetical membrane protein
MLEARVAIDKTRSRCLDPPVAKLAIAGIAAPILFSVIVMAQGVLQPDYRHVALPISALAAWPAGWIQNLNFSMLGVLMSAYSLGLHRGVHPTRSGIVGPAILMLSGAGIVTAGIFPWRMVDGAFEVPTGHRIGAVFAFMGAGFGLVVVSRRMATDPRWRGLAGYALASGLTIVALFVMIGVLAVPDDGPLHAWAGLLQRVVLAVWFSCTVVLATRLLRLARTGKTAV